MKPRTFAKSIRFLFLSSVFCLLLFSLLLFSLQAQQFYTKNATGNFTPVVLETNATGPFLSGPFMDLLSSVATWTNLTVAGYGIYDTGTKQAGFGLMALYNATSWGAAGIGLQDINGEVWMPNAQFQLQAPLTIAGTVKVTPLAFTGIGVPIAGRGSENGTAVGIYGAGLAATLWSPTSTSRLDAFFAVAKWTGFQGEQWYAGLAYRF